jgi:uncharacterized SAM-binding protein YcdF (DUF218 family)
MSTMRDATRNPTEDEDARGAVKDRRGRRRSRVWRATLPLLVAVPVVLVAGGFIAFAEKIVRSRPPADARADAIVVLTGGAQRIDGALALIEEKRAKRLLISGVNRDVTTRDLQRLVSGNLRDDLACCVDLGKEALDTIGNAAETRHWAEERGFSSLIVVTSDYHMPRSMTELAGAMPNVELIPYPVPSAHLSFDGWWHDPGAFGLLAREYGKYLVANARQLLPSGALAADAAPDAAP